MRWSAAVETETIYDYRNTKAASAIMTIMFYRKVSADDDDDDDHIGPDFHVFG